MASLPGGAADKLGNRYEDWWAAYRLADILNGAAVSMRPEPPGGGGIGIEFVVEEAGATWGEQVKSDDRRWTLHRLETEGVLDNIRSQLERGRHVRLVLSADAHELKNLAGRSRAAQSFVELTDDVLTKDQVADLQNLARIWKATPEESWRLLRRVEVEHHPAESLRRLVRATYELLFSDSPDLVVNAIRGMLDANLHTTLTAPHVWGHLTAQGLHRRLIAGDDSIATALRRTVDRHARRVAASSAGVGSAARTECEWLTDLLRKGPAQVVVVDGRAGSGKSTVVVNTLLRLVEAGWHAAAIRMDSVDTSATSSRAIGRAADLSESPVVLLAGVSQGRPAVLVIDQLDAVSIYTGRIPDVFDAVSELLDEAQAAPNVRVVLVVRTVDVENDPRLRQLVTPDAGTERFTIDRLELDAVKSAVERLGANPETMDPTTLELLRVPLHLGVLARLPEDARRERYRTLPELYDRFTDEARRDIERRLGGLDWAEMVGRLVAHMSDSELLTAPAGVLDTFSPAEVNALESWAILVRDEGKVSFFHETYFDFLFARGFVAAREDLHAFLVTSGQHLFRRAQTRQVLEYLAGTNREQFRLTVVRLLESDQIRPHLQAAVLSVLSQIDARPADWEAIEHLAWADRPVAVKLINLLSRPRWFDAADTDGRWERWIADPDDQRVDRVMSPLLLAARERPQRVEALVRPHVGTTVAWRNRLLALIQWSLEPALTDLAVDLITRGDLDDARGVIAVNSDFWSLIYGPVHAGAPAAGARLIGAYLQRHLDRARADGSLDPFTSGQLATHSPGGGSVIRQVAEGAPSAYIDNVLPFVKAVVEGTARQQRQVAPTSRWGSRHLGIHASIDGALFAGLDDALGMVAADDPTAIIDTVRELAQAPADDLRFLACRAYRALHDRSDEALEWLLSDIRNLRLGWSDSPRWATRELIASAAATCSDSTLESLTRVLMTYEPAWERRANARELRGRSQYDLLSAVPPHRQSEPARKRIRELERKFTEPPAAAAPQAVVARAVESPIIEKAAERMSNADWINAFHKYRHEGVDWSHDPPVGGASELAQVFGDRVAREPERFAQLLLTFDREIPAAAFRAVLDNASSAVDIQLLESTCIYASTAIGSDVGRSVCSAIMRRAAEITDASVDLIGTFAIDPDPDKEDARTALASGDTLYGGDFAMAGLNSTRGRAALAAAAVLSENPGHTDRLLPIVAQLTDDPIMAVRVAVAEAIPPLLNHRPDEALDLAERLLSRTAADIYETRAVGRLLVYCLIRNPTRFATELSRALVAGGEAAETAGAAWAVMALRETIPDGMPDDVTDLQEGARKGAATVFASNAPDAGQHLRALFDDSADAVRREAASAMRYVGDIKPEQQDELIQAFLNSPAFDNNFEGLVDTLERLTTRLPTSTIEVVERIVTIGGSDLGDIRTSHAAASRDLIAVLLRLYRQGHKQDRIRCLNVIDRLAELGALGLNEALESER